MTMGLCLSLLLNIFLAYAIWILVRDQRSSRRSTGMYVDNLKQEIETTTQQVDYLLKRFAELANAVSKSMNEIRQDIDRNYHHIHDLNALDRLGYEIKTQLESSRTPWEFHLSSSLAEDIRLAGGKITAEKTMWMGDVLNFAWQEHHAASKRSVELYEIIQESCGKTDKAIWLSKSLAIFERICGYDKAATISIIESVVSAWKYTEIQSAVLLGYDHKSVIHNAQ